MDVLLGGFLVLGVAVVGVTWLGAAVWVYRDAQRRDLDRSTTWGLGVLLTGYFGFLVYVMKQGSSRNAALKGSS